MDEIDHEMIFSWGTDILDKKRQKSQDLEIARFELKSSPQVFFFFLLRDAPAAYESFWARG